MIARDGAVHDIPDDEVQGAYQSGKFGLPKGSTIPVVMGGRPGRVAAEDAHAAFASGARLATPEEQTAAVNEEKYGGVGGGLAAAGEGLLRGASMGLADPLIVAAASHYGGSAAGEAARQHLAGVKEAHPYVAGGSELTGAALPLLATDGASATVSGAEGASAVSGLEGAANLAKAAEGATEVSKASEALNAAKTVGRTAANTIGAPAKGVAALGSGAEKLAARLVGSDAESLGLRIAQKAAAKAAGGAVEGAAFGVGNEISEDTLGDHQLTGEKLLAAAGHGALLGGAAAGTIGALGELGRGVLGKIAPKLEHASNEEAFRATNARKAFTTRAIEMPDGIQGVGAAIKKAGLSVGDTVETLAPKLRAATEEAGAKLGTMVDEISAKAEAVPAKALYDRAGKEFADLAKMPTHNAGALKAIGNVLTDLQQTAVNGEISLAELRKFRSQFGGTIDWSPPNPLRAKDPTNDALKKLWHMFEDEVETRGDVVAAKEGGTFAKGYKEAKLDYRRLKLAADAAEDSVDRAQANASHSLTDKIMGAHGMQMGFAHGGPLGAIAGLATGAISKEIRTRGNATAAVLLDKMSTMAGIRRAAEKVDAAVDQGVAGFFKKESGAMPRIKPRVFSGSAEKEPHETYDNRVKAVTNAVANADHHADGIASAVSPIGTHAPNVSTAFQKAALVSTAYLASQIPSGKSSFDSLTPQVVDHHVSDYDKIAFNRKFDAVNNPVSILNDMAHGRLTKDQVQAVKATHPKLFAEMQQKAVTLLGREKHVLSPDREIQMRILLELPRTGTILDPSLVSTMQSTYANAKDGGASPGNTNPQAPPRKQLTIGSANVAMQGSNPNTP